METFVLVWSNWNILDHPGGGTLRLAKSVGLKFTILFWQTNWFSCSSMHFTYVRDWGKGERRVNCLSIGPLQLENIISLFLSLSKWFNCNCTHAVWNNRKHLTVGMKLLVCNMLQYVTEAQTISTETFIISVCFPNVYQYSSTYKKHFSVLGYEKHCYCYHFLFSRGKLVQSVQFLLFIFQICFATHGIFWILENIT